VTANEFLPELVLAFRAVAAAQFDLDEGSISPYHECLFRADSSGSMLDPRTAGSPAAPPLDHASAIGRSRPDEPRALTAALMGDIATADTADIATRRPQCRDH
jgi:hypothetical protein